MKDTEGYVTSRRKKLPLKGISLKEKPISEGKDFRATCSRSVTGLNSKYIIDCYYNHCVKTNCNGDQISKSREKDQINSPVLTCEKAKFIQH